MWITNLSLSFRAIPAPLSGEQAETNEVGSQCLLLRNLAGSRP